MVMAGGVSAGKDRKAPFRVKVMDMKLYLGKPGSLEQGALSLPLTRLKRG
jgi:hypothetical protein